MRVAVRPVPRTMTRLAAVGAVAIVAGLAADQGQAATQPAGPVTLTYACRFPSGARQVGVRVAAAFPASARLGRPIRPTPAAVTVTIPRTALTGLIRAGAASVAATAQLTTDIAQNGTSTRVTWAGLTAPPTPVPAKGSLVLTASGPVPAVKASHAGDVTVTAGPLALILVPHTSSGAAASPATVLASCAVTPGQGTTLAGVTVTPAATPAKSGPPGLARRAARRCPPAPKRGLKLNKRFPLPRPPRGSRITHPPTTPGCAFVVGYANVRKLRGAALVGPGKTTLVVAVRVVVSHRANYDEFDTAARLNFKGRPALPPARATFLAFGFVPTSATLQLTEIGTINIVSVGTESALNTNKAYARMSLRVHDVRVNGTALNVGAHCRTVRPLYLVLTGKPTSKPPYSIQLGGPLSGKVTIPAFTGCGVSENLDPLFTGSISGPGNLVKLTQGNLCTPAQHFGCPARKPRPLR
jgi:hypothetical protein